MKRSRLARVFGAIVAMQIAAVGYAAFSGSEDKLMQIERDTAQAWVKKDAQFIDRLEAKEYVYTNEDGVVSDKAADMATLKNGTTTFETFAVDDLKVVAFEQSAVVVGRITTKGTYMAKAMSGTYRFTDSFIHRDGRWQIVASQSTRIASP